jgi:putative flavoprotein involved in K+ transport
MKPDDTKRQISGWLESFGAVLARGDVDAAAGFFDRECYWRDLLAFTWTLKTCEGRDEIKAMLAATLASAKPTKWTAQGPPATSGGVAEGWFTFETAVGRGIGHVRLKGLKCWTLLTTLQELKGHEETAGRSRETGVAHGAIPDRKSWLERRQQEEAELGVERQPYVVIVGGGQAGIALAARLRRMGVPNIILEKNERPGDSWRKRYRSLVLHDPVWYDHLPYLPFPDHWPVFSPKDKMGDWLEMYAKVMELNYWSPSLCTRARYDAKKAEWEVAANWEGKPFTLRPKHLVLATGMSGVPSLPEIPGAESFRGRICHSSQFDGGAAYREEHCVVVGANNSAHDIAADLWEHGAQSVTMIQRSPTVVVTSEALMEHAWGKLYSQAALEAGISTEIADLTAASVPFKILPTLQKPIYDTIRKRDAKLYEGLEKAGFLFHFGEDGSGVHTTYMRRGAGYYIDVGASQMIIDGKIKLKSKVEIEKISEKSVLLSDGTELPADLIVFATGYGSMNGWAEQLISKEVADKVGKVWGLGSGTKYDPGPWVGELRNMWQPTAQDALWFHGGNLMQARHYSLYLALQLKARMEGIPTPVFK